MLFPAHPRHMPTLRTSLGRLLLALLLVTIALSNILVPLIEQRARRQFAGELPVDLTLPGWGQDGFLVASILLLFVGHALVRGKRQAWFLAVALIALSLLDTFLEKSHWLSIVLTAGVLLLLLILAPLFSTRSDTGSFLRGYSALVLSGMCLSGYGTALHVLQHDRVSSLFFTRGEVLMILKILCFLTLWYGVTSILRPVHLKSLLQKREQWRVETTVQRYGRLALAYFALGADKCYFWSQSHSSLVAYRVVQGVALALGDPIGPEDERELFLKEFFTFCQHQDWRIVFYQASPQTHFLCQTYGLHTYKIGEEAIIDVEHFTLQGKSGAAVRHAVTRAKRDNVVVRCWQGQPLPDDVFADMKRLSATWMHERKIQDQFGFSMGRFPLDWSPELLTVVAFGAEGEVQAFLTWTPMHASAGWALDVMRRGRETSPGTMEFLIATAVEWAKAQGYRLLSLGLAPLAGILQHTSQTPCPTFVERSAAYLHQHGMLLGQYRSLYAFKAKFQPHWEDRYLIVNTRLSLPQVLFVLAHVHGCGVRYLLREMWSVLRPLKRFSVVCVSLALTKEGKCAS